MRKENSLSKLKEQPQSLLFNKPGNFTFIYILAIVFTMALCICGCALAI
ncbi:MAG: hypothetical protein J6U47_04950 [Bacteroidales bacterium]|nr:hypothetical protein [Bacteroidales bacterium]MBR6540303.1 hypothetical protein [Bacteroidales bacterium]